MSDCIVKITLSKELRALIDQREDHYDQAYDSYVAPPGVVGSWLEVARHLDQVVASRLVYAVRSGELCTLSD